MRIKVNGTYVDESTLPAEAQADLRALKRLVGLALVSGLIGVLMIPTGIVLGIAAVIALFTSGVLAAAQFAAFGIAAYGFLRGMNSLISTLKPSIALRVDSLTKQGIDVKNREPSKV